MALTSTISNTIKGPTGTAVSGVLVVATLMPTAGFRVDDSNEVARAVSTTSDVNGAWSLALERNSNITPSNTYYQIVEFIPTSSGGTRTWNIQVGASNQTVSASLVTPLPTAQTSNVLTQAAADARYQTLGSLGSGTPAAETAGAAGIAGVSTSASRADHVHPAAVAAPTTVNPDGAASVSTGVAATFAASDHGHTLANSAWTSWTPTWTNLTVGNGTVTAKYLRVGKGIFYRVRFTLGSTSAMGTDPTFTLPVTAAADYVANDPYGDARLHLGSADYRAQNWALSGSPTTKAHLVVQNGATAGTFNFISATVPGTWAAADTFSISGFYEAA